MSVVPVNDCGSVDFDAIWRHYLDAGFLYPAKLANLEPHLPLIRETWPKLLAAPPEIMQFFAAGNEDAVSASVSLLRDTEETFIIMHAVSQKDPAAMYQCLLKMIENINQQPSYRYAAMFFRPRNRWPRALQTAFQAVYPSDKQAVITRRYLTCHAPTKQNFSGINLTEEDPAEVATFLQSLLGSVLSGALGAHSPLNLAEVDRLYQSMGLRRERAVLGIRENGALVGVALCCHCSALANFSGLCSRAEIHVSPEAENRGDVVRALATGAIDEAKKRGNPLPTLLILPEDASFAVEAGWIDIGTDYSYFVWERESETGWDSAYSALQEMYKALDRRRSRQDKVIQQAEIWRVTP